MSTLDLRFVVRQVAPSVSNPLGMERRLQFRTRTFRIDRDFTDSLSWGIQYGPWSEWQDVREEAE